MPTTPFSTYLWGRVMFRVLSSGEVYQRAKLVVELVDDFALNLSEAAKQIGMSSHRGVTQISCAKSFRTNAK